MREVLLATSASRPQGEQGAELLDDALAARGVRSRWAVWDDPTVDWSDALVVVRSTWDYDARREQFLDWARSVPWLLNGAGAFAWNTDKSYLLDLARSGLPTVPSHLAADDAGLRAALATVREAGWPQAVVKPRVAAGGRGLVVLDADPGALDGAGGASALEAGPWLVQPLVESVRSEGETSVFVIDGEVVSQARKVPGGAQGEIRVHPQYGGSARAEQPGEEHAALARRAVRLAQEHTGGVLDYARVDVLRLDGTLVLGEIELTEPALYLPLLPHNATVVADLLLRRTSTPPPGRRPEPTLQA